MIYVAKMGTPDGDTVEQVIVVDADYEIQDDEILIGENNTVGIGWKYDGTKFYFPESDVTER